VVWVGAMGKGAIIIGVSRSQGNKKEPLLHLSLRNKIMFGPTYYVIYSAPASEYERTIVRWPHALTQAKHPLMQIIIYSICSEADIYGIMASCEL
jgi:hypothetical protein